MLSLLSVLVQMFIYVIFAHAIMSLLLATGVIDLRNSFVSRIWHGLSVVLEPFYKPIRRFIPPVNGIDFTPMVLLLMISVLRMVLPI